jgi:hypothetical protein
MRRKEKAVTEIEKIETIIVRADSCRLGMFDGETPYIVPMSFGYHNRTFYFHSASEGRKIDILKKFPRVCIEIDVDTEVVKATRSCGWGMRFKSVIAFGNAQFVTDSYEKAFALQHIMRQFDPQGKFTFEDESVAKTAVIRVDVDFIEGKISPAE